MLFGGYRETVISLETLISWVSGGIVKPLKSLISLQPRRVRPVDEAAKARLAQRSGFRKRAPPRAAKIG